MGGGQALADGHRPFDQRTRFFRLVLGQQGPAEAEQAPGLVGVIGWKHLIADALGPAISAFGGRELAKVQ